MYIAQGNQVLWTYHEGADVRAECDQAQAAVDMLNKARRLNDVKRRYTAAARLIAQAESLDGFRWVEVAS